MKNFNLTLTPDLKSEFSIRLATDKLKATAFVRYFLSLLINGEIDQDTINQVLIYQETYPGNVKDFSEYFKIIFSDEEHIGLFSRKLSLKILPQHFFRYFIEKYSRNEFSSNTIEEIRKFVKQPGFPSKSKQV